MSLFGQSKRDFLEFCLPARNGIPTSGTFSRVFRLLVPKAFRTWFLGSMPQFGQSCEGVLAVDGKTLRRSYDLEEAPVAFPLGQRPGFRATACSGQTGR